MMVTKWRSTALYSAFLATMVAGNDIGLAGKPTQPFPLKYQIQFLRHPDGLNTGLSRISNSGIAAGASHCCKGYLFDAETGAVCWEIRDLVALEDQGLVPEGVTYSIAAISDSGKVTGTMWMPDGRLGWAYVLDTNNDLIPGRSSLRLIDSLVLPGASRTRGYGINEMGDVLGRYFDDAAGLSYLFVWNLDAPTRCHWFDHLATEAPSDLRDYPQLNTWGQVAGQLATGGVFRYTPWAATAVELFPQIDQQLEDTSGLNDDGVFCGKILQGNKNVQWLKPYRCYDTSGDDFPLVVDVIQQQAYYSSVRINSSCDL
ncbi:MAG: hypothetical protein MUF48_10700, partial [Pirellulaceae bacterium]|nr:hypothetical protein [Pirellulaceae bacterium]